MSRTKKAVIGIIGSAATVGCVLFYLSSPRVLIKRSYKDPDIAKWLRYFNIDTRTRTHPSKLVRIVELEDGKSFLAESLFPYDFLKQQDWTPEGRPGKFYTIINGRTVSTYYYGGTNGNCVFPFDRSELRPGTNRIRLDILVLNPLYIHGWIHAEGPSIELVIITNVLETGFSW